MTKIRIGIIQERKTPPDFRVPLTPKQCAQVVQTYSNVELFVESSPIRCFSDEAYEQEGIAVVDDVSHCDILFGVKEVPIEFLFPNKTYFFFSHTLKKQPYNAKLLRAILDKRIELIDYEALKGSDGKRIIGFGRYAGIVGVYEGIRAFGWKHGLFNLPSPQSLSGRIEFDEELGKIDVSQIRAVLTGWGRVGNGAEEVMKQLDLKCCTEEEFLQNPNEKGVYVHIDTPQMYKRIRDGKFDKSEFYSSPELYTSNLEQYAGSANLYIAAHLWNAKNPILLSQTFFQNHSTCSVVSDISCDLNGPIACTIRSSKIGDPVYGYDVTTGLETSYESDEAVAVMAIDNLPCELPKDASEDFGSEIIKNILPRLIHEDDGVLATGRETTKEGTLTAAFEYLSDYATGH
jgi:alanine dehydrogenase